MVHLSAFVLLAILVFLSVSQGKRSARLMAAIERLRTGNSQIQVRADLALVAVVVALANSLGLESILAAFTVGIIRGMTAPGDRLGEQRLDTVALGIFIPFFFVASGIDFHLDKLFETVSAVIQLPLFVIALLAVHMLAALIYRREMGRERMLAAGLLQATSFSFVIVATQLGLELGIMKQSTAAALVAAGLISVVAFPALAFRLLGPRPVPANP
jgi:Kef-type K+ transport system membrane component KefB